MRTPPPLEHLDEGIREVVRFVFENGFAPVDSGDGSKAGTMEGALDYPHVFIRVDDPTQLVGEADRLHSIVKAQLEEANRRRTEAVNIRLGGSPSGSHHIATPHVSPRRNGLHQTGHFAAVVDPGAPIKWERPILGEWGWRVEALYVPDSEPCIITLYKEVPRGVQSAGEEGGQ